MILTLKIDPAELPTAQQKGVRVVRGRPMFFEKSEVTKARARLIEALLEADTGERPKPCDAWGVFITYFYKPKSMKMEQAGLPKSTRPDVDNLTKLVLDAITDAGIAWDDDAQATTVCASKRYAYIGEPAHVVVMLVPDKLGLV